MAAVQEPSAAPFNWLVRLSFLCLFAPFVWMKVDHGCTATRYAHVPDVWILGGWITGKDMLWPGILHAWIAQTAGIVIVHGLFRAVRRWRIRPLVAVSMLIPALVMMAVFPLWISTYVNGVIHNSDGVCFIIQYTPGWLLCGALMALTAWTIAGLYRRA